jgi:WD40-like Beta Propeller Repeat
MYAISGNTVREYFPRTNQSRTLMTIVGYSDLTLDGHGQNSSADGRWVAVTANRQRDNRKVMFGINLASRQKGPDIEAPSNLNQGENVFISDSGKYLIAALGYGGKDQNIYDVLTGRLVNTYRGDITTKHPDTYQLNGRDYWIFVASGGRIGGRVLRRDILTNQEYTYMDMGYANHVSTRNVRDPRWAIVTYDSRRDPFPLEIMAVRIDGDHRKVVRRLAKHNSVIYTYSNEPHPNPSPDGKKIVFASNWGGSQTSAYVILLPEWDTPAGGTEAAGRVGPEVIEPASD